MRREILIVGERVEDVMGAAADTKIGLGHVIAVQAPDVVERALALARSPSRAMVLLLSERDNLADLRALLMGHEAPALLVAPRSPPSAALARLAAEFGAALCGRDDPPAVRQALLVALAAGGRGRA